MSSALGIAAVTAVLENLLNSVFNPGAGLGTVKVSAVAPDIVQNGAGTDSAILQVNLFLHQVVPSAAWRNQELPSLGPDGKTRLKNPPLALDLHYLLTAYATGDCEAEALLGFAVQFLHENPVLSRNDIRTNLGTLASNPSLATLLSASGLADQIEMIKITPATLGREEVAWLWTALKADYRPTFPFQVSVVLLQTEKAAQAALPVLQRQVTAQPNLLDPFGALTQVIYPGGQPAASLGDTVTVQGANLAAVTSLVLTSPRLGIQQVLAPPSAVSAAALQFVIPKPAPPVPPASPTDLPAGLYLVLAQTMNGSSVSATNSLPLTIAPAISVPPASPITPDAQGNATVTVTCAPYLRPGQEVFLLIGGWAAPANPFVAPTNTPAFTFSSLQATSAPLPVRLRVDGIDSPIIDLTNPLLPVFTGPTVQIA
jgi:hypothetical protein